MWTIVQWNAIEKCRPLRGIKGFKSFLNLMKTGKQNMSHRSKERTIEALIVLHILAKTNIWNIYCNEWVWVLETNDVKEKGE